MDSNGFAVPPPTVGGQQQQHGPPHLIASTPMLHQQSAAAVASSSAAAAPFHFHYQQQQQMSMMAQQQQQLQQQLLQQQQQQMIMLQQQPQSHFVGGLEGAHQSAGGMGGSGGVPSAAAPSSSFPSAVQHAAVGLMVQPLHPTVAARMASSSASVSSPMAPIVAAAGGGVGGGRLNSNTSNTLVVNSGSGSHNNNLLERSNNTNMGGSGNAARRPPFAGGSPMPQQHQQPPLSTHNHSINNATTTLSVHRTHSSSPGRSPRIPPLGGGGGGGGMNGVVVGGGGLFAIASRHPSNNSSNSNNNSGNVGRGVGAGGGGIGMHPHSRSAAHVSRTPSSIQTSTMELALGLPAGGGVGVGGIALGSPQRMMGGASGIGIGSSSNIMNSATNTTMVPLPIMGGQPSPFGNPRATPTRPTQPQQQQQQHAAPPSPEPITVRPAMGMGGPTPPPTATPLMADGTDSHHHNTRGSSPSAAAAPPIGSSTSTSHSARVVRAPSGLPPLPRAAAGRSTTTAHSHHSSNTTTNVAAMTYPLNTQSSLLLLPAVLLGTSDDPTSTASSRGGAPPQAQAQAAAAQGPLPLCDPSLVPLGGGGRAGTSTSSVRNILRNKSGGGGGMLRSGSNVSINPQPTHVHSPNHHLSHDASPPENASPPHLGAAAAMGGGAGHAAAAVLSGGGAYPPSAMANKSALSQRGAGPFGGGPLLVPAIGAAPAVATQLFPASPPRKGAGTGTGDADWDGDGAKDTGTERRGWLAKKLASIFGSPSGGSTALPTSSPSSPNTAFANATPPIHTNNNNTNTNMGGGGDTQQQQGSKIKRTMGSGGTGLSVLEVAKTIRLHPLVAWDDPIACGIDTNPLNMTFHSRAVEVEYIRFQAAGGLKSAYAIGIAVIGFLGYFLGVGAGRDHPLVSVVMIASIITIIGCITVLLYLQLCRKGPLFASVKESSRTAVAMDYALAVLYAAMVIGFSMNTFTTKEMCESDMRTGTSGTAASTNPSHLVSANQIPPSYPETLIYLESDFHYMNICDSLVAPFPVAACMLTLLLQRPRHKYILPINIVALVLFIISWVFVNHQSQAATAGFHIGLQLVIIAMAVSLRYVQERFQRRQFIQYACTLSKLKHVQEEHDLLQSSVDQMLPPPIRRQLQQASWSLDVAPLCTVALLDIANVNLLFPDEVGKVNTVRVQEPEGGWGGGALLDDDGAGGGLPTVTPNHAAALAMVGDAFENISPVDALNVIVGIERSLTHLCGQYGFTRISIFGDMFCCASNLFSLASAKEAAERDAKSPKPEAPPPPPPPAPPTPLPFGAKGKKKSVADMILQQKQQQQANAAGTPAAGAAPVPPTPGPEEQPPIDHMHVVRGMRLSLRAAQEVAALGLHGGLALRAAVHCGLTMGTAIPGRHIHYAMFGEALQVASKTLVLAGPNQIFTTESALHLAQTCAHIEFTDTGKRVTISGAVGVGHHNNNNQNNNNKRQQQQQRGAQSASGVPFHPTFGDSSPIGGREDNDGGPNGDAAFTADMSSRRSFAGHSTHNPPPNVAAAAIIDGLSVDYNVIQIENVTALTAEQKQERAMNAARLKAFAAMLRGGGGAAHRTTSAGIAPASRSGGLAGLGSPSASNMSLMGMGAVAAMAPVMIDPNLQQQQLRYQQQLLQYQQALQAYYLELHEHQQAQTPRLTKAHLDALQRGEVLPPPAPRQPPVPPQPPPIPSFPLPHAFMEQLQAQSNALMLQQMGGGGEGGGGGALSAAPPMAMPPMMSMPPMSMMPMPMLPPSGAAGAMAFPPMLPSVPGAVGMGMLGGMPGMGMGMPPYPPVAGGADLASLFMLGGIPPGMEGMGMGMGGGIPLSYLMGQGRHGHRSGAGGGAHRRRTKKPRAGAPKRLNKAMRMQAEGDGADDQSDVSSQASSNYSGFFGSRAGRTQGRHSVGGAVVTATTPTPVTTNTATTVMTPRGSSPGAGASGGERVPFPPPPSSLARRPASDGLMTSTLLDTTVGTMSGTAATSVNPTSASVGSHHYLAGLAASHTAVGGGVGVGVGGAGGMVGGAGTQIVPSPVTALPPNFGASRSSSAAGNSLHFVHATGSNLVSVGHAPPSSINTSTLHHPSSLLASTSATGGGAEVITATSPLRPAPSMGNLSGLPPIAASAMSSAAGQGDDSLTQLIMSSSDASPMLRGTRRDKSHRRDKSEKKERTDKKDRTEEERAARRERKERRRQLEEQEQRTRLFLKNENFIPPAVGTAGAATGGLLDAVDMAVGMAPLPGHDDPSGSAFPEPANTTGGATSIHTQHTPRAARDGKSSSHHRRRGGGGGGVPLTSDGGNETVAIINVLGGGPTIPASNLASMQSGPFSANGGFSASEEGGGGGGGTVRNRIVAIDRGAGVYDSSSGGEGLLAVPLPTPQAATLPTALVPSSSIMGAMGMGHGGSSGGSGGYAIPPPPHAPGGGGMLLLMGGSNGSGAPSFAPPGHMGSSGVGGMAAVAALHPGVQQHQVGQPQQMMAGMGASGPSPLFPPPPSMMMGSGAGAVMVPPSLSSSSHHHVISPYYGGAPAQPLGLLYPAAVGGGGVGGNSATFGNNDMSYMNAILNNNASLNNFSLQPQHQFHMAHLHGTSMMLRGGGSGGGGGGASTSQYTQHSGNMDSFHHYQLMQQQEDEAAAVLQQPQQHVPFHLMVLRPSAYATETLEGVVDQLQVSRGGLFGSIERAWMGVPLLFETFTDDRQEEAFVHESKRRGVLVSVTLCVLLVVEGFGILLSYLMADRALPAVIIVNVAVQELTVLIALLLMLTYRSHKPSSFLRHASGFAFAVAIFYSFFIAALSAPGILGNDFTFLFAILAVSTLQAPWHAAWQFPLWALFSVAMIIFSIYFSRFLRLSILLFGVLWPFAAVFVMEWQQRRDREVFRDRRIAIAASVIVRRNDLLHDAIIRAAIPAPLQRWFTAPAKRGKGGAIVPVLGGNDMGTDGNDNPLSSSGGPRKGRKRAGAGGGGSSSGGGGGISSSVPSLPSPLAGRMLRNADGGLVGVGGAGGDHSLFTTTSYVVHRNAIVIVIRLDRFSQAMDKLVHAVVGGGGGGGGGGAADRSMRDVRDASYYSNRSEVTVHTANGRDDGDAKTLPPMMPPSSAVMLGPDGRPLHAMVPMPPSGGGVNPSSSPKKPFHPPDLMPFPPPQAAPPPPPPRPPVYSDPGSSQYSMGSGTMGSVTSSMFDMGSAGHGGGGGADDDLDDVARNTLHNILASRWHYQQSTNPNTMNHQQLVALAAQGNAPNNNNGNGGPNGGGAGGAGGAPAKGGANAHNNNGGIPSGVGVGVGPSLGGGLRASGGGFGANGPLANLLRGTSANAGGGMSRDSRSVSKAVSQQVGSGIRHVEKALIVAQRVQAEIQRTLREARLLELRQERERREAAAARAAASRPITAATLRRSSLGLGEADKGTRRSGSGAAARGQRVGRERRDDSQSSRGTLPSATNVGNAAPQTAEDSNSDGGALAVGVIEMASLNPLSPHFVERRGGGDSGLGLMRKRHVAIDAPSSPMAAHPSASGGAVANRHRVGGGHRFGEGFDANGLPIRGGRSGNPLIAISTATQDDTDTGEEGVGMFGSVDTGGGGSVDGQPRSIVGVGRVGGGGGTSGVLFSFPPAGSTGPTASSSSAAAVTSSEDETTVVGGSQSQLLISGSVNGGGQPHSLPIPHPPSPLGSSMIGGGGGPGGPTVVTASSPHSPTSALIAIPRPPALTVGGGGGTTHHHIVDMTAVNGTNDDCAVDVDGGNSPTLLIPAPPTPVIQQQQQQQQQARGGAMRRTRDGRAPLRSASTPTAAAAGMGGSGSTLLLGVPATNNASGSGSGSGRGAAGRTRRARTAAAAPPPSGSGVSNSSMTGTINNAMTGSTTNSSLTNSIATMPAGPSSAINPLAPRANKNRAALASSAKNNKKEGAGAGKGQGASSSSSGARPKTSRSPPAKEERTDADYAEELRYSRSQADVLAPLSIARMFGDHIILAGPLWSSERGTTTIGGDGATNTTTNAATAPARRNKPVVPPGAAMPSALKKTDHHNKANSHNGGRNNNKDPNAPNPLHTIAMLAFIKALTDYEGSSAFTASATKGTLCSALTSSAFPTCEIAGAPVYVARSLGQALPQGTVLTTRSLTQALRDDIHTLQEAAVLIGGGSGGNGPNDIVGARRAGGGRARLARAGSMRGRGADDDDDGDDDDDDDDPHRGVGGSAAFMGGGGSVTPSRGGGGSAADSSGVVTIPPIESNAPIAVYPRMGIITQSVLRAARIGDESVFRLRTAGRIHGSTLGFVREEGAL